MPKRLLTPLEVQFCKEAEAGYFDWAIDDNGYPYAIGEPSTGNLFSMQVREEMDYYDTTRRFYYIDEDEG